MRSSRKVDAMLQADSDEEVCLQTPKTAGRDTLIASCLMYKIDFGHSCQRKQIVPSAILYVSSLGAHEMQAI